MVYANVIVKVKKILGVCDRCQKGKEGVIWVVRLCSIFGRFKSKICSFYICTCYQSRTGKKIDVLLYVRYDP